MYRSLLVACFTILTFTISLAQEVSPPMAELPWHIRSYNNAIGNFYSPSSFRRSICYLPEGGVVAAAQYTTNTGGAVRIKEDGKAMWQAKVDGWVTGIGRIGDNFIVFYSDENEYEKDNFSFSSNAENLSKKLSAALIDGKTGKVIKKELIHENEKAVYTDYRALNRPDGSFAALLIRVTGYKKSSFNFAKEVDEILSSKAVYWVDIDATLSKKSTEIKSAGLNGLFVGAELGTNDNLLFSTIIEDQLTVERFDNTGKLVSKLSAPLIVRTIWNTIEPVTTINPENPESILIGIRYTKKNKDPVNQVFEFDMKTKKVSGSGEQELNKDYRKSVQMSVIKEIKNGADNVEDALRIMNIIVTKERIAVVKTMLYSNIVNDNPRFRNDAVVIDIYDRSWKLLKTVGLDRMFETFIPVARSVGAKVYGEKLRILIPALKGTHAVSLYAEVDLINQNVDVFTMLDREGISSSAWKNGSLLQGDASIWTSDGVWIENLVNNDGFFKKRRQTYSSIWQKVKF